MRTFEHFPEDKTCVICGYGDNAECTLIPIDGTDDGDNCEATPVHAHCVRDVELRYNRDAGIVYKVVIKGA